jgi:4-amino-4-deoxy-L-arabinose transferase-like glycosyltransferase
MHASHFTSNVSMKSALLVGVPLVLTAFTHLWNPIGFPSIYVDEAHYMRRVMNVLEGLGPQESEKIFHHPYDHPYFGQIFLASILGVFGYPDSLNLSDSGSSIHSIEILYMVPRLVMGVLAVVDTFVIYKIAERRYDTKVAFIASLFFAIMPVGWFVRRIWLESIQLPFLLLSILLVVRRPNVPTKNNDNGSKAKENILMVLLSGVLLGLALFTKIPAFTMIPLVGYLVYTSNNKNLKILGIWFIPVISISLIWPAYAMHLDQFDRWYEDVFWQASRAGEGDTVSQVIVDLFKIDPLLFVLGVSGFILSVYKRELFLFLWILPYIIFSYIVVHSSYWYFIPLIPAFCIGAARLLAFITILINKKIKKKRIQPILSFGILSAIGLFGLISTTILITTNVTSSYFRAAEFIAQSLPTQNQSNNNRVLVTGGVGLATFTWIPMQILDMEHDFRMLHILFTESPRPIKTTNALFVVDRLFYNTMAALMNMQKNYDLGSLVQILEVYNSTATIAVFVGNTDNNRTDTYPYFAMKFNNQLTPSGPDRIEIRANFQPTFSSRIR